MDIGLRNFQQLHQGHPKSPFFHQKLSRSWQNNFRSFPSLLGQEMSPTREALLLTPKFNEQSTKKSTAPSITQNCWSFEKHFGIPVDLFYSFSWENFGIWDLFMRNWKKKWMLARKLWQLKPYANFEQSFIHKNRK